MEKKNLAQEKNFRLISLQDSKSNDGWLKGVQGLVVRAVTLEPFVRGSFDPFLLRFGGRIVGEFHHKLIGSNPGVN